MRLIFINIFLLPVFVSGCVTLDRYRALEDRVITLERHKAETERLFDRDLDRLENLNDRLHSASEELHRNGASLNARIEGTEEDFRRTTGRIEELAHLSRQLASQMDAVRALMDERFGVTIIPLPPDLPTEPEAMLTYAREKHEAAEHPLARAVLEHFLKTHNEHEKARQAQLLLGDCFRAQQRYRQALKQYFEVYEPFADSPASRAPPEAATALWLAANALGESGECRRSLQMYRLLVRTYRNAPETEQARERIRATNCN